MRYDALETELAAKLNAYFTAQAVDTLFDATEIAENETEASRITDKGRVHVMYTTSKIDDTNSTSSVQQKETITVAFIPECDKLRGDGGVYHLVQLIKDCMLGYVPTNGLTAMKISGFGDWQLADGALQNVIEMSFEAVNMQTTITYKDDLPLPGSGNLNAGLITVKSNT
jgi:hypothetical protein